MHDGSRFSLHKLSGDLGSNEQKNQRTKKIFYSRARKLSPVSFISTGENKDFTEICKTLNSPMHWITKQNYVRDQLHWVKPALFNNNKCDSLVFICKSIHCVQSSTSRHHDERETQSINIVVTGWDVMIDSIRLLAGRSASPLKHLYLYWVERGEKLYLAGLANVVGSHHVSFTTGSRVWSSKFVGKRWQKRDGLEICWAFGSV